MGQRSDRIGTLGILGGGQLARMTALAAHRLGYATHVLDPSPSCSAKSVVERLITAPFDSTEHALELARECDVVTVDIERIPAGLLEAVQDVTPVHPGAHVLRMVQDRAVQKNWLKDRGYPVGDFRTAKTETELESALSAFTGRRFVKRTRDGYDGQGQCVVDGREASLRVWHVLGTSEVIVEREVSFVAELSVMVARSTTGEIVTYPPALNRHEASVLSWSVFPALVPDAISEAARQLGARLARELDVVGLLCVELFLLEDGSLLINELAPRPHNSFHHTERASETSQFEQLVRAVVGLPLGSVEVVRPAAICNLLGELWESAEGVDFQRAFSVPGVTVQLYGKTEARTKRKLGHLTATGATQEEALSRVLSAKHALSGSAEPPAPLPQSPFVARKESPS